MDYSKSFIEKVKTAFPNSDQMHKALDAGGEIVGRILDDSCNFTMRPVEIVKAFEQGDQQTVLKNAKRAVEIGEL